MGEVSWRQYLLFAFEFMLLLRPAFLLRAALVPQSAWGTLSFYRLSGARVSGALSLRTKWRVHGPRRPGRAQLWALRRAGTKAACGKAEAGRGRRRGCGRVGPALALPPRAAAVRWLEIHSSWWRGGGYGGEADPLRPGETLAEGSVSFRKYPRSPRILWSRNFQER